MSKKRQIKSLQQYAQMKGEERRSLLKNLSDDEYENVMKVLGQMPYVDFQTQVEGTYTDIIYDTRFLYIYIFYNCFYNNYFKKYYIGTAQ